MWRMCHEICFHAFLYVSCFVVTKGFMYSSFLKPYNPRRSQSDVSIESQSSNESGYGGSSPVFSRQNSNSTLTFNQETSTVSFSTSQPQVQPSPQPSLDSSSSRRSHHRDTGSDSAYQSFSKNSLPQNPSNQRESLDQTHRSSPSQRDAELSYRHSGSHRDSYDTCYASSSSHKEMSDLSETDSASSHRNNRPQFHGHTDKSYSSSQWRNGDSGGQKKSSQSRNEYIEPEPEPEPEHDRELDGHQVRFPISQF